MNEQTKDEVRTAVREQYGSIARSTTGASCCAPGSCGPRANASLAPLVELEGLTQKQAAEMLGISLSGMVPCPAWAHAASKGA